MVKSSKNWIKSKISNLWPQIFCVAYLQCHNSSQFLKKKKTLNIISDQNLDTILFRACFLESLWSYIYKLQQILKSCGAKDFWIVLMILLTYQFIDEAQKGNSAFCLAKSFEGRNPKFFTRFIKHWWKLFKKKCPLLLWTIICLKNEV